MAKTGAVFVALPWLEALSGRGQAWACEGLPKRFGLFFWGNGVLPEKFQPIGEGSGEDWQLSEQLTPLAAIKHKITVVGGMSVKVPNEEPHDSGVAGLLTGSALHIQGDDHTVTAPTIDQVIAAEIGDQTLYRSIQTSATDGKGRSYNGPDSRNPPEHDPYALYERLFGDTFRAPGEEGIVDPKLGLRRSVLDSVMTDIGVIQGQLGSEDQARLERHLDGIRELETRLARLEEDPPNLESCSRPDLPTGLYEAVEGRVPIPERNQAIAELTAMALACDQTRVFAHFISDPVGNALFPGASAGHHNLTHNEPEPQPEVNAIVIQCMEALAVFLGALDAIPEGEGTLLDNCVVMAASDVSKGRTHSIDDIPLIFAGGGCGALKTNFHYRSTGQENASKAVLSAIRAMDILKPDFGTEGAWTDEGLSAIEA